MVEYKEKMRLEVEEKVKGLESVGYEEYFKRR